MSFLSLIAAPAPKPSKFEALLAHLEGAEMAFNRHDVEMARDSINRAMGLVNSLAAEYSADMMRETRRLVMVARNKIR